jgi:hypothetical protein
MRIAPTFNVAYRALRRNKMRSVLTALGIIIGVGAVIAMVGIGNGAKAQVESQIASLGDDTGGRWKSKLVHPDLRRISGLLRYSSMAAGRWRAIYGAGCAQRKQGLRDWSHDCDGNLRQRESDRPDFAG